MVSETTKTAEEASQEEQESSPDPSEESEEEEEDEGVDIRQKMYDDGQMVKVVDITTGLKEAMGLAKDFDPTALRSPWEPLDEYCGEECAYTVGCAVGADIQKNSTDLVGREIIMCGRILPTEKAEERKERLEAEDGHSYVWFLKATPHCKEEELKRGEIVEAFRLENGSFVPVWKRYYRLICPHALKKRTEAAQDWPTINLDLLKEEDNRIQIAWKTHLVRDKDDNFVVQENVSWVPYVPSCALSFLKNEKENRRKQQDQAKKEKALAAEKEAAEKNAAKSKGKSRPQAKKGKGKAEPRPQDKSAPAASAAAEDEEDLLLEEALNARIETKPTSSEKILKSRSKAKPMGSKSPPSKSKSKQPPKRKRTEEPAAKKKAKVDYSEDEEEAHEMESDKEPEVEEEEEAEAEVEDAMEVQPAEVPEDMEFAEENFTADTPITYGSFVFSCRQLMLLKYIQPSLDALETEEEREQAKADPLQFVPPPLLDDNNEPITTIGDVPEAVTDFCGRLFAHMIIPQVTNRIRVLVEAAVQEGEKELQKREESLKAMEVELNKTKKINSGKEQELKRLQKDLKTIEATNTQLKDRVKQLNEEIEQQNKEIERLKKSSTPRPATMSSFGGSGGSSNATLKDIFSFGTSKSIPTTTTTKPTPKPTSAGTKKQTHSTAPAGGRPTQSKSNGKSGGKK